MSKWLFWPAPSGGGPVAEIILDADGQDILDADGQQILSEP